MSVIVSSLYTYPVKSLRGNGQRVLDVTDWGPDRDRRWMVIDESGQFVTQRQQPKMCLIAAEIKGDALRLWNLKQPGNGVCVDYSRAKIEREVFVWEDNCTALDAGDEVAEWLSDELGARLRLCYMPESTQRQVALPYGAPGDRVSFADGFPFLLCNEASLQVLSSVLGRELDIQRFRPNIVISGAPAFAEDGWKKICIGGVEFDLVKPCARCAIPTVNLEDASREPDVFRVLQAQRKRDGEVYFGQNMIHRAHGAVAVGDAVDVLLTN
tara:strand:+ start:4423 stop:5229 length:807 start_codon:yes stop_codon:yes gene_type:complete